MTLSKTSSSLASKPITVSVTEVVEDDQEITIIPPALTIPHNASQILLGCLAAQVEARNLAETCEEREVSELRDRAVRLPMLRAQRARRVQLTQEDDEATVHTNAMLAEVVEAVRDRCTSLRPEGYQAFAFINGDIYEGGWKNAKMHGKGVMRRLFSRDIYEGQWFLGQRYGSGCYHSGVFQTWYCGAWLDNKRHGRGELIEPEGVFTGEFVDNRISGYGEYIFNDGHLYKGEWCDDLFHGTGTYLYPSGAKYEGNWRAGYEDGRGTLTHPNGDVYVGDWREGKPHGRGVYTSVSFRYEGSWAFGQLEGTGSCIYSDGTTYVGDWHCGVFHGEGVLHCPRDGIHYAGTFAAGRRHGFGEYTSPQVLYEGEWREDKKDGYGTVQVLACENFQGVWHGDVPMRSESLVENPALTGFDQALLVEAVTDQVLDLAIGVRRVD